MSLTTIGRASTLAAALLIAPACMDIAFAQKESETVDRTVPFPANGILKLRNFSGDVHITATSGHDVVIKAVRSADRDKLDHIKLDISTSGSTVSIDANKRDSNWSDRFHDDNVVETRFEIQVPASAAIDAYGFSSDLDIKGVTGSQKVETFSGTITVTDARGALTAKTFSGNVELDASAAGAAPVIKVETFSGDIRARLAGSAKGDVAFSTFSGNFDSELPLSVHTMKHNKVSGTLPGGSRSTSSTSGSVSSGSSSSADSSLSFHTFSGNVTVKK